MAVERLQSASNRLLAQGNPARLVVDGKKPTPAPEIDIQARPARVRFTAKDYGANLWARMKALHGAKVEARYAAAHVAPLVPAFDILRPRG